MFLFCQEESFYINRQIATLVSIPAISAINPASRTNLVLLILTLLVYTAIVYTVVSVDPIITAEINPNLLSTPKVFIMSVAIAIEAFPEIGLSNANGIISFGKSITLKIGDKIFTQKSIIPEFLSILIATNNPTSVGKILNKIFAYIFN